MKRFKFVLVMGVVLALLAGGALAQIQIMPPMPRPFPVGGVITAIDLDKGAVTLNGPLPTQDPGMVPRPITFFVNDLTRIFKNGQPVPLAALAVGDLCKAMVIKTPDGGLLALEVHAQSPEPPLHWVKGKIERINLEHSIFALRVPRPDSTSAEGVLMVFYVDRGTRIVKDGRPASLGDLMIGDLAAVGFVPPVTTAVDQPIRASVVEAKTPPELIGHMCGKIVRISVEDGVIAVAPVNADCADPADCVHLFKITNLTLIDKFGEATIKELCVGDSVCVAFRKDNDAAAIPPALTVFVNPEKIAGIIAKIDYEAGIVVIRHRTGAVELKVIDKTRIFKNGRPVPLRALRPRDCATAAFFHYEAGNVAMVIWAKGHWLPPDL